MSRVGRLPIAIPDGVSVEQAGGAVRVKGPKGTLSERLPSQIQVTIEAGQVLLVRPDDRKQTKALHGLSRALVANMVTGVTTPFSKELEIQGVGYRADVAGKVVKLQLGFSHPVEIAIPDGLKVSVERNVLVRIEGASRQQAGGAVRVKGPKGTLSERLPSQIQVTIEAGQVLLVRPDDRKQTKALHGLSRALVANMVTGVTTPFSKELEIQGVGYRADVAGKVVKLQLGFSHPVEISIPDGLKVSVDRNVLVRIEGASRQQVGQFAANLRGIRPPEPYKGKGIRYVGEHVRRKVGKAGASAGG